MVTNPGLALAPDELFEEIMAELTVGMATYRDYDGVVFTVQALRLYQDLSDVEILVLDDFGCKDTEAFARNSGIRYVRTPRSSGPAAAKDRVFHEAKGRAVLCLDCHVLLAPGSVARLKQYYRDHPESHDLLQGPLLLDDLGTCETHFDPVWRGQMFGIWACDPRGDGDEPFEIPMQGMGLFSCRKDAWLGFSPRFRGFGGEEGYIHEKFRRAGRRCLCLPWLRWWHRFGRPHGVPYPLHVEDRLHNYLIACVELEQPVQPVLDHFLETLPAAVVARVAHDALGHPVDLRSTGETRLVSCLCPTFNRAPGDLWLLEEAIESFLLQDYPHKELVILNDTPGQTIRYEHPLVRVVNVPERYPTLAAKLNALVSLTSGDLLCRWDDDDISLPWRLSLAVRRLGTRDYWKPEQSWTGGKAVHVQPDPVGGLAHNQAIFTRDLFDRVGGYRAPSDGEDTFFERQLAEAGIEIHHDELPRELLFYIYRWNTGSPHVSGFPNGGYERMGARPVTSGEFGLRPHWRADYVDFIKRRCLR